MIRVRGLLILLLLLPAVPAVAQTRLFALFSGTYPCSELGCPSGTLIDIDAESGRINGTTPITPGWGWSSPAVTPDGSYLVFGGYRSPGAHLDALDTSSYGVTSFYVSVTSPTFGYAVHPGTSRAYFQRPDDERLFVVDASGVRPWPALTSQRPGWLRLISGDGSRLVIHRHLTSEAAVVDTDTGVTSGVVSDVAGVVAVNSDGTEIYSFRQDSFAAPLQRRLVSSGAVLASANVTGPGNVFLARDPRTGHIWFANNGRVRVMDGSTLATIAERGFTFGTAPARLAFDPDRPIVYIGWKATSEADNLPAHFVVFNTETMAVEAEADILLPRLGYVAALVLGPRPPRVEALSADVNGASVTLSWTTGRSRQATRLIVEAGSQHGMANLARFVLPPGQAGLLVPDVPPGTYFVRVRAANATGEGLASNEITVTVPSSPN